MPLIREVELADCDAINSLSRHLDYAEATADITQERLQNLPEPNSDWVWVFESSGNILGCYTFSQPIDLLQHRSMK